MAKTETDCVIPMVNPIGSSFQSYLEEEGIAEEVNMVALEHVAKWQNPQLDTPRTNDIPPTDEEEASFSRMPTEFF